MISKMSAALTAAALLGVAAPAALALHAGGPPDQTSPAALAAVPAANPLDSVDHFKCYQATNPAPLGGGVPSQVGLTDEFLQQANRIGKIVRVCNPVIKIHGDTTYPVHHPTLHLVCFAIRAQVPRLVEVRNQFGLRRLDVTQANRLCLPSYVGGGGEPLGLLDHYKCYDASEHLGPSGVPAPGIPDTVGTIDDFGNQTVQVAAPTSLCNPVRKVKGAEVTPIRFPDIHLVCFKIRQPQNPSLVESTVNQFGQNNAAVGRALEICLPSRKRILAP